VRVKVLARLLFVFGWLCGSPEIVEGFLSRFGLRLVFPDLIVDG
jgi:hypothetical protein